MSYSFSLSGHSSGPHNAKVKEVFDNAVKELKTIPGGTVSGTGYSNDNDGRVELDASKVE
jgi:hypothetical protein